MNYHDTLFRFVCCKVKETDYAENIIKENFIGFYKNRNKVNRNHCRRWKEQQNLSLNHDLDTVISSRKVLKKFILDYGFLIYNVYNKNNVSHKSYNPYSSAIKIEELSMFIVHFNGVYEGEFLISWRRGELNSRPKQKNLERLHVQLSD